MEGFIYDLNLIKGLNQASQLPVPIYNYLVEEILKYIMEENNQLDCNFFEDICLKEEVQITAEKLGIITDSLVYLLRFYFKKEINTNQIITFLQENTVLEEKHLNSLKELLEGKNKKITNILKLSKLRNLQWSIRNYMGDEKYPDIYKIYILLELTVQDNQGVITKQAINLTLTEFKIFVNQIKEINDISADYEA